jgi:alpha-beta hydrolase superfamily lysophospholipase
MAEHSARYEAFADYLNAAGIEVYAPDLRGHGLSVFRKMPLGWLGEENGWYKLVEDFNNLHMYAMGKHPKIPIFLLGHSMGSVVVRNYLQLYPDFRPSGAVIMSTAAHKPFMLSMGQLLVNTLAKFRKKSSESKLMAMLTFGPYNAKFQPQRTFFDWLSRDTSQVDAYVADPLCGSIFPYEFWIQFFMGLGLVGSDMGVQRTPASLPMLWLCGDMDPVGDYGKGVQQLVDRFVARGCSKCSLKVYEGARHELLNETNRNEVFADITQWLIHTAS